MNTEPSFYIRFARDWALALVIFVLGSVLLSGCDFDKASKSFFVGDPLLPVPSSENRVPDFHQAGGRYSTPTRIQTAPGGTLLVADPERQSILRAQAETGLPDQSLFVEGKPLSVAMVADRIVVGVQADQTVNIYDHTGAFQNRLAPIGSIGIPTDIVIDRARWIVFVLDGASSEVKLYSLARRSWLGTIGTGDLYAPAGIAIHQNSMQLLVSDYGANAGTAEIRVFSYAPNKFGKRQGSISGQGRFSTPRGMTVAQGQVFVTDGLLGQVLVFDLASYELVTLLGRADWGARDLRTPADVAVRDNGDVFVTSPGSSSVVVFPGGAP